MEDKELKQLLQMLINVIARGSFPEDKLRKAVIPAKSPDPDKYLEAFNLCDGKHSQAEIATKVGLDQGNLSRVMDRWVSSGIIFELGESNQAKFLHIYPLAPE